VRGLWQYSAAAEYRKRSTPARAGIIQSPAFAGPASPEHPRACGDYAAIAFASIAPAGAPPRVRGLSVDTNAAGNAVRSTPARAGII